MDNFFPTWMVLSTQIMLARLVQVCSSSVRFCPLEKNLLKISSPSRHYTAAEPVLEGEIFDKDDEPIPDTGHQQRIEGRIDQGLSTFVQ